MHDTYLQHHGVKGQRWGIRRFQKKDGTRTPLGKKREREDNEFLNRAKRNAGIRRSDALTEARSKNINKLTTEELKKYNDRLQAEENYVRLTKGTTARGKEIAMQWGLQIAAAIVTGIAIETGKSYVKNQLSNRGNRQMTMAEWMKNR